MSLKKSKDLILGVVMLLFSGFYLISTQLIKTRPKLTPSYASAQVVPMLLGVLLAIMSVLCIRQGIRKMKAASAANEQDKPTDKGGLTAVVLTFAVMIGYTLILAELGFCLSTVIYLVLQFLVLAPKEKRNVPMFILIAVVFTAFVFVAFRIGLQMLLPRGIIESLIGF